MAVHQGFPAHPQPFLRAPRQHPPVCAPSPPQARWPFGALCLDYSEPIGLISPTTSVCPHNLWQIAACSGQKTEQGPWQRVRAINPLPAERGAHTRQPWRQHPKCQGLGLGGCKGQRRVQELQGDTLGWGQWQQLCRAWDEPFLGSGLLHSQQEEKDGGAWLQGLQSSSLCA